MLSNRSSWLSAILITGLVATLGCNDVAATLPDVAMGTDAAAQVPPTVGNVTCTPTAIACNNPTQAVVTCSGAGMGFTGTATYVWKCIPEIGCKYASPAGASQTCIPGDGNDTLRCDSDAGKSSVEITCNGKKPENCSLVVVKDNVASLTTTMPPQGHFAIGLSPACPMPGDMMLHDGGAADMAHDAAPDLHSGDAGRDGGAADAAPASDVTHDAAPADVSQDLIGIDTRG